MSNQLDLQSLVEFMQSEGVADEIMNDGFQQLSLCHGCGRVVYFFADKCECGHERVPAKLTYGKVAEAIKQLREDNERLDRININHGDRVKLLEAKLAGVERERDEWKERAALIDRGRQEFIRKATEIAGTCCESCDYDEAEGALYRHCDACQESITADLWLLCADQNMQQEPSDD